MDRLLLQHGTPEPPPERIPLRAGPLAMAFEPETAFLRYLRHGEREVLRGIYAAVRDRDWGTVLPRVTLRERTIGPDTFRLVFDAECRCERRRIDFAWRGVLEGTAAGLVVFRFDGAARAAFLRNRIGFCILHPAKECAGQPCRVLKDGGAREEGAFPRLIAADQPFLDLRGIAHEVEPGVQVEVYFKGDLFEMEDQRNWTDATFKTYSTPLRLPFPVEVQAGEAVRQSVTVSVRSPKHAVEASLRRLSGAPAASGATARTAPRSEVTLRLGDRPLPLPRIGLGLASHGRQLTPREAQLLKALAPAHLRADLELSASGWRAAVARAAGESASVGAPLELALFLGDEAERELDDLARELAAAKPAIAAFLVFHRAEKSTGERWIRLARERLAGRFPGVKIGAGTNAYFAELNRAPPPPEIVDLFAYSLNPQVHAFDDATLVENLEGQAWTVESARAFAGGKGIAVSPVTLRPRFNPDATGPASEPAPDDLPPEVDPRQMSLLGAGWTLGSIARLAAAGAESITYYETTGWRGVIAGEAGSPLPEKFPASPGAVFPMYHVFADLAEFAGAAAVPGESGAPLEVDGLALVRDGALRVLIANLTPEAKTIEVDLSTLGVVEQAMVRVLDETSALQAMTTPDAFRAERGVSRSLARGTLRIELKPFAVARVDLGRP